VTASLGMDFGEHRMHIVTFPNPKHLFGVMNTDEADVNRLLFKIIAMVAKFAEAIQNL
jgi:hypothetical protein